ncbi:TPA: hypothetical protein DCZ15_03645 [Candidatus Falkowbacteria bacterium]|nr:hypothetical protein [Candidatus Falkowbacteria bacterium]
MVTPVTSAAFFGRAYPQSTITLLKDAQFAATTIAGADANFQLSLTNLSGGNYIFSIYAEDNKGNRSSLLTFPTSVIVGATAQVSGIFIPPTIAIDKREVKQGDDIVISGRSVPNGEITIAVNSETEFLNKVTADATGAYFYNLNTTALKKGQYFTKSQAAIVGGISSFGKAIGFSVGDKNLVMSSSDNAMKGDVNGDRRVNLVDFSIVAYWHKRSGPPVKVDLNGDGAVTLADLSIVAFYWTG